MKRNTSGRTWASYVSQYATFHWLVITLFATLTPCLVWAAGEGQTAADLDQRIVLNIEPNTPLDVALIQWGAQSRVQVMMDSDATAHHKTPSIRGTFRAADALTALLNGSGLAYKVRDATVTVTPAGKPGDIGGSFRTAQSQSSSASGGDESRPADAQGGAATNPPSPGPGRQDAGFAPKSLEEIVVTGSRLSQSGADATQEVQVFTKEQIDSTGRTTVAEFLNTVPSVSTAISENGFQSIIGGTTVQLHGLPIGSTLVLVNGRRVESSPAQQSFGVFFDLNNIPLAAVQRIEVVPEGSSAVYGSDAIAGVVNIILNNDFKGLQTDVKYGHAEATSEYNADLLWGNRWDAGSIVVVGSFLSRDALRGSDRPASVHPVYPQDAGSIDFSGYGRYTCHPGNVYFPNGFSFDGHSPVAYAAVPAGFTGSPSVQEFASTAGTLNACNSYYSAADFIPATDRAGGFASGTFRPGEHVELFAELMYSVVRQRQAFTPSNALLGQPGSSFFSVPATNPYNPFGETVSVSTFFPEAGQQKYHLNSEFFRPLLGARGQFHSSWSWEAAAWEARDQSDLVESGLGNPAAYSGALASSDPAMALNPFVDGSAGTPQLFQSLLLPPATYRYSGQTAAVNAFVRGPLARLPAGTIDVVLGTEYDHDRLVTQTTAYSRNVHAVFGEARLPILGSAEHPATFNSLAVTAAVRYDHYNDFGGRTTPQAGVEWRPLSSLLIRGSYGGAFKAPSLYALYAPMMIINGSLVDPKQGQQLVSASVIQGGNRNLRPETGISRTLGVVFDSERLPGLRVAVTYWNIDESDSVQILDENTILQNEASFPELVQRDAKGNLISVRAGDVNFGRITVKGLDYELRDRLPSSIGEFTPALNVTQTYHYQTALIPGARPRDVVSKAQDGGVFAPRWKGALSLGWKRDPASVNLAARYVGRYQDYDSTRTIGNFWLLDATARWEIGRTLMPQSRVGKGAYISVGIVNLLNRLPQDSSFSYGLVGYDPTQADLRGRFSYVQLGGQW